MSRPRKPGGRLAWMAFYVDDFLSATTNLSRAALGSYVLLILAYWRNRGPLKDSDVILAATARCSRADWRRDRELLETFFQVRDGLWHHDRIDLELQMAQGQMMAAAESARLSNESKGRGRTNARKSRARTRTERVREVSTDGALSHNPPSSFAIAQEEPACAAGGFGQKFPYESTAFREAWGRWVEFRVAQKTPLTEHSVRQQFRDFVKWGESRSIASIEQSIRSDWQGLFEPKGESVRRPSAPARPAAVGMTDAELDEVF